MPDAMPQWKGMRATRTQDASDLPAHSPKGHNAPKTPVIISASRSTDIPAFYAEWFINRLKEGYVTWINPFNGIPLKISFDKTRLIVFWTKDAKNIINYLNYLDDNALQYYFQFTLNDYDEERLEPRVPDIAERIETFQRLSDKIGKEKIIWRFDPLILTDIICVDELLRKIENIGEKLTAYTNKLVFSFADIHIYKKVQNNLQRNAINYKEFDEQTMNEFASGLQRLNEKWKFELSTCAEKILLQHYGITHNKCIDDDLIVKIFSHDKELMDFLGVETLHDPFKINLKITKTKNNKDKGQREHCGCIVSKDIGAYNTCAHLCEYCYATTSKSTALSNYAHNTQRAWRQSGLWRQAP